MTTKLLSRWHGPYEVVEKMGDKTYVIMMPFKGEMKPMVQNFRNLWKVGRATDQPAAVEMSDFTDIFEEGDLSNDGEKERDLNENNKNRPIVKAMTATMGTTMKAVMKVTTKMMMTVTTMMLMKKTTMM